MAPSTQTAPTTTQRPTRPQESDLLQLPVPYFSQRDSATWQGHWMCFSSTCAMAAAFLRPGCLAGAGQPDDRYLALVERFGDTTNAAAQVQALERLGIQATFRTDGCLEQLIAQLRLGIPIPVGWLHQGPASAPRGGGHWSLVVGWDPRTRQVLMLAYRQKVQELAERRKGKISPAGKEILADLAGELGWTTETAVQIEAEVLQPFRDYVAKLERYRSAAKATLEAGGSQSNGLSSQDREELKELEQRLKLGSSDVAAILHELGIQGEGQAEDPIRAPSTAPSSSPGEATSPWADVDF